MHDKVFNDSHQTSQTTTVLRELSSEALRWQLKAATHTYHAHVEDCLALDESISTRGAYRQLLKNLLGFYQPIENAIERLDWTATDIDVKARRKSTWLASDLVDLGFEPGKISTLPHCQIIPAVNTVNSGLGVLYVLEGATLGGQVVIRDLADRFGYNSAFGGRFFSSYGLAVGAMWREYLQVLEQAGLDAAARAEIERAAIDTFRSLLAWLESVLDTNHAATCEETT